MITYAKFRRVKRISLEVTCPAARLARKERCPCHWQCQQLENLITARAVTSDRERAAPPAGPGVAAMSRTRPGVAGENVTLD